MAKLLIPSEVQKILLMLLETSQEKLDNFSKLLDSEKIGTASSLELIKEYSESLECSGDQAHEYYHVIRYLKLQISKATLSVDEFVEELVVSFDDKHKEKFSKLLVAKKDVIKDIFRPKPIAELAQKKKTLENGLLKTLASIEGVCDYRPIFNLERTEIIDSIVNVTARIRLENDADEEEYVLVQLNQNSIKKLEEFLEITKKKIKLIKKNVSYNN